MVSVRGATHQVQRHVLRLGEITASEMPGGNAPGGGDPSFAVRNPFERHLLGKMVELVPSVVGRVRTRIGDLGEREESRHYAARRINRIVGFDHQQTS